MNTDDGYTIIGLTGDGRLIMQKGSSTRYCHPPDNPQRLRRLKQQLSQALGPANPPKLKRRSIPDRPLIHEYVRKGARGARTFYYDDFVRNGKTYRKHSRIKDDIERWLDEMKPIYEKKEKS